MTKLFRTFAIAALLSFAQMSSADIWSELNQHPDDSVMILFNWINKFYRPSGGEETLREQIKSLAREAEAKKWKQKIVVEQDKKGNFLLRIPGTGKAKLAPSVAIQSHLDMIIEMVNPKSDPLVVFKDGVRSEVTDGWIHSANFETTLGADDGSGVSNSLLYLVDPTLEHPPLELIFTVEEEVGMTGALDFNLDVKSNAIINLDWETAGTICHGCMGADNVFAHGDVLISVVQKNMQAYTLNFSGLEGGHSGLDMHDDRTNAITLASKFILQLESEGIDFYMVRLNAGQPDKLNGIPSSSELTLAIAPENQDRLQMIFRKVTAELSPKNQMLAKLEVKPAPQGEQFGLRHDDAVKFFSMILELHDQVIERDPAFPQGIRTSSNIGFLQVGVETAAFLQKVKLGYMLRSFSESDIEHYTQANQSMIRDRWRGMTPKIFSAASSKPWVPPDNTWLYQLALKIAPEAKPTKAAGSLEAAILARRFPDKDIISIGPTIQNLHTIRERMNLESVRYTQDFLQRLLLALGSCQTDLHGQQVAQ